MDAGQIQFRKFDERDYHAAVDMVVNTWRFYKWVPAPVARAMGEYYLCDILEESDTVWAAEDGGALVGVAGAKNNLRPAFRLRYRLRQWRACLRIIANGHGKSEFLQFIKTEALDRELLAAAGRRFDAELTLLIVRGDYKGRGIGGALYRRFLGFLSENDLNSFCLFTDSSCNYRFYEHYGLKRLGEKTFYWQNEEKKKGAGSPEEYYLYGNMRPLEG